MDSNCFGALFGGLCSNLPDCMAQAQVASMTVSREKAELRVGLRMASIAPKARLYEVQKQLCEKLRLKKCVLSPQYDVSLLDGSYIEQVVEELRHRNCLVNGFLDGVSADYQGGVMQIHLKRGGLALLQSAGSDRRIREILRQEFGADIEVVFDGVTELEEYSKEFTQSAEENRQKIVKIQQEKQQAVQEKKAAPVKCQTIAFDTGDLPFDKDSLAVVTGRAIKEKPVSLDSIDAESGKVTVWGDIFAVDSRESRDGSKVILAIHFTDYTSSNVMKVITEKEKAAIYEPLTKGKTVLVRGEASYDKYDGEISIRPYDICTVKKLIRQDQADQKRVELHAHTKMSAMDAVVTAKDLVNRAYEWGHKAIAITDHGVVQAFPEAAGAAAAIAKSGGDFKVIYGVESYFINDMIPIVNGEKDMPLMGSYIVFDLETTGLSAGNDRITEIGAVKLENGEVLDSFNIFVNPQRPIPEKITQLTGITDEMVADAPLEEEALRQFYAFCGGEDAVLVAHNAPFDTGFIKAAASRCKMPYRFTAIDTVPIARKLFPNLRNHKLDTVAKHLQLGNFNHHRACDDARILAEIYIKLAQILQKEKEIQSIQQINTGLSGVDYKNAYSYHQIILVKNLTGLKNLYQLVSKSHLDYYYKKPRIPKSELIRYREGLILGSACEAGELFRAVVDGKSWGELCSIAKFYDFLEIQPIQNNMFMVHNGTAKDEEQLRSYNRTIVRLGDTLKIPVCATCDVHMMDEKDNIFRQILLAGMGFKDTDQQSPLYLRTTDEMLREFSYLGEEKAYEVVVTNPNSIADRVEKIKPIPDGTFTPTIEGAEEDLQNITWSKAREIYGDPVPALVAKRLDRELTSIIKHGFAVLYIIAQKLVWKSVENGYLVGSRGSVGSSFVATMAGISEVNPLPPHYVCPHCKHSEFITDGSYGSGFDLPAKNCPECGTPYQRDGHDIPFETFLGFNGDKAPDIDLNFSGEYQSKAHKYTEVIFGAGQTFRAGTIATLADKTAFGYVKNYFEERGIHKRTSEIDRIASGCTGVRRSTGQHPGGIVVLPLGQDINSFTPVQHPANDMTTDTITTHFDYHSIDHNLLKLDILGHDDPTMIRMLQDLTGRDPLTIPLDGQDVMSLFQNTDALGITPEQIGGTKLGALGIPEFGTDFAMQMVIDAKPKAFSDLVRISGLSHGTNVWLGNAQDLIMSGVATISTAICTRDDIMLYLIQMGVESEKSFKIMEAVRKGMVAKGRCAMWEEWKEDMLAHNVPQWYIESCQKIEYMFPKAHAAAYVMMAWRIAYCKIHYPLAYYGAFFSIRAKAFSYEIMCQGQKHLESVMVDYKKRQDTLSNKEKDAMGDMHIVQEMYARGFEFEPIDIFRAQSRSFQIVDGKLMPSLNSIDGLGEKAADAIVEAAKDGPFLSKDDFRQRTKVSKTIIDLMDSLGLLGDLPESNQISIFDLV